MTKKILIAVTFCSLLLCAQNNKPVQPSKFGAESALDIVTTVKPVQKIITGYVGAAFAEIQRINLPPQQSVFEYHLVCEENSWKATPCDIAKALALVLSESSATMPRIGERVKGTNHTVKGCLHDLFCTVIDLSPEYFIKSKGMSPISVSSPDNRYTATSLKSGQISIVDNRVQGIFSKLFNLEKQTLEPVSWADRTIYSLWYSPDSRFLAACTQGSLRVWDTQTNSLLVTKKPETCWAFSRLFTIGENLAVHASKSGVDELIIYDLPTQLEK